MRSKYDYIVIGDGIVGRAILYFLTRKFPQARIAQIANEEAFPSCTRRTTSVVSMGIFEEGISMLGNLLHQAHEFFEDFVKQNSPDGVISCKQYYLPPEISQDPLKFKQFESRYGSEFVTFKNLKAVAKNSYVINPAKFLTFLEGSYACDVEFINARVSSLSKGEVRTLEETYYTDKVIVATSAYTSLFFKDRNLPEGKPVKGTYFTWDIDLNEESFVISQGHYNLIYRDEDKLLLFGANSVDGFNHLHATKEVRDKFSHFLSLMPELSSLGTPQVETGIRHKGKKRTPYMGEVSDSIYAVTGLYKNGWSAGISLADQLVDLL